MSDSSFFTLIHADGGARPNPGEAAYAAILQNGDKIACVRGYVPHATNNQMELAAVIAALSALKSTKIPVKVAIDSQYVHGGASRWLKTWRNNGWQTASGDPLQNTELWQELDRIMSRFVIAWTKVEGHSSDLMNNRADELVWDTRQAKGDPAHFAVTDLPTIESDWSYTAFTQSKLLPAKATQLKEHFQTLLKG